MSYALTNSTLYTGDQVLQGYALVIEADRIVALVPELELAEHLPQLNGQGWGVAPGFIDLQLNGCGGVMFNDDITAATLDTMHRTNLNSGTTSFLPTLITTSDPAMAQSLEVVAHYRQRHPHRVLGLHLEGPYLHPKRRGIHDGTHVRLPDEAMIQRLIAAGPEVVRLLTLAPERVSPTMIQRLVAAGIRVSAGHSEATYEEALVGFEAGVSMVTHLFNAMSPWLGRAPGLVGAVFNCPEVYAGVIADGHHVHYGSIQLAHRLKQNRLVLVSDAMPPVGTTMSSFRIGGQEVFYREGKCISAEGTLGGSALTLIEAVRNCVQQVGIALEEALRMASLYPAQAIGVEGDLGRLAPGFSANLLLFDPQQLEVRGIIDQGQFQWVDPDRTVDLGSPSLSTPDCPSTRCPDHD